jgi:hypothetical protein
MVAALWATVAGSMVWVPPLHSTAAPDGALVASSQVTMDSVRVITCSSDSMLIGQTERILADEFGVALEADDSIETSRVDIQERGFGVDRAGIRLKAPSAAMRRTHPSISSPLLV